MALIYKGDWALTTDYFIDDYITDVGNEAGQGAGVLLYCVVVNTSSTTNLNNDWVAGYWAIRSGDNTFYKLLK